MEDDVDRLNSIKDDKKVFADSIVLTTALLKNCVKVHKPNQFDLESKPEVQKEHIVEVAKQ